MATLFDYDSEDTLAAVRELLEKEPTSEPVRAIPVRERKSQPQSESPPPTVIKPTVYDPKSFNDFIGQENSKKLAKIMVDAAKRENRDIPNILIIGGFGLGKTSLGKLIIQEFKGKFTSADLIDGLSINRIKPESGTIIVDEIHLLDPAVADRLNVALDSGKLHIIGCTTDPGKLPSAFRSRFRTLQLDSYTVDEIADIAAKVCERKKVGITREILLYVARRSRFNARQVTIYLAMIFDLLAIKGGKIIDQAVCDEAFQLLGVDQHGFLERDKQYMRALSNKVIGLKALSATLGIDIATIENEIEPYLLQQGLIDRTPRGRVKLREIGI